MRTRAAVALAAGRPLEVMEVNLDGPRAGEVLVEIKATGICHTDEFTRSGADPEGLFPAILGHEGAGVVVEVGPGVTTLKPGDHVIPLYTPECRECEYCLNPKTNLCQKIRGTQGKGLMPDGTSRFSMLDGTPILHYMGCSTFANHTVLPEIALAKVRQDAPFDKICYIGCGVTTGIGAVINTAKVEIGSRAIVFGLGGIGLNVIQGLRLAGADQIVGVDLNPDKVPMAQRFGMTDFVNPKEVKGDLVGHLVELTRGGADYTFDARQRAGDAHRARIRAQGLGREHHHRRRSRRGRDQHAALPARHRAVLARHGLRRRAGPHRRAEDRRLVHGRQDRDRPDDHPHHAARRDQYRLRPDARRQEHPVGRAVLRRLRAGRARPARRALRGCHGRPVGPWPRQESRKEASCPRTTVRCSPS